MRIGLALTLAVSLAGCDRVATPAEPSISVRRTSVSPHLDAAFGPIVLARCEAGFDLLYQQEGTVTAIETTDANGEFTRLQFVWHTTISVSNSETGLTLSGPSRGPDQTTFNEDGTTRLLQIGLVGMLRFEGSARPLTVDAGRIEFRIARDDVTIVSMSGPHPHHEGFPERPVLCALLDP